MPLHFERLEPRCLMAAGIVFNGGILTITGGDFNDDLLIEGTGQGSVTVTADLDGIAGNELADIAFAGVTEIRINLGLGNDFYDVEGIDIAGSLKITDLVGNNEIFIDDLGAIPNTIGGNVDIRLGVGTDSVDLIEGTTVRGNVTITDAGGDGNAVTVEEADIFGNLNVSLGSGSGDSINLTDSDVHGNVTLTDKGGDDNSIDINGKGSHDLGIGGKLTMQTGRGNGDTQFINDARVGNGTDLKDLGGNDNTITIYVDNVLIGPTTASTGTGDDDLIEVVGDNLFIGNVKLKDAGGNQTGRTIDFGSDNLITGNLDLRTGTGRDSIDISQNNIVHGSTTITDAGGGDNRIAVSELITRQLGISTGSGSDVVLVDGSTIGPDGVTISTGRGADIVSLFDNILRGHMTIDASAGNDDVSLSLNRLAADLMVNLGAGDDEIDIYTNNIILGLLNLNGGAQVDRLGLATFPALPPAVIRNFELFRLVFPD